jgi:hypothetical protein
MKVALGFKAHSGWAALVAVGTHGGAIAIADRRRVELIDEAWAKQPYHAAENLETRAARATVQRGIAAAQRIAAREIHAAVIREEQHNNPVAACAVLVANPMPDWSVEEIIAVHIRMHQAEGVLFRDALLHGAKACGLDAVAVAEKLLIEQAQAALGEPAAAIAKRLAELGKVAGPPWGKDQKDAALAAIIALRGSVQ